MGKKGVSIIIPVHNSAIFLDDCLGSVLSQADQNTEILIVENGSTDNTPNICREYCNKWNNIIFIEMGDVGVSVARNMGIDRATKEYLMFLDSDDMLQPGAIKTIMEKMTDSVDICLFRYSNQYLKNSKTNDTVEVNKDILLPAILQYAKYYKKLDARFFDAVSIWTCWGKCYRTDFVRRNRIFFPNKITHSEDTFFFFQAINRARRVNAVDSVIYFYRANEFSVTQVVKCSINNNLRLIQEFEKYRRKHNELNKYSSELNSFYALKILDLLFLYGKTDIQALLQKAVIRNAIKTADVFNLIIGKKNQIKYTAGILYLKSAILFT